MADAKQKEDLSERTFEQTWVIKDWGNKIQNEASIENANTEIICQAQNFIIAKFMVGTKLVSLNEDRYVRFYWKITHTHQCLENIDAHFVGDVLNSGGTTNYILRSQLNAFTRTSITMPDNMWKFSSNPGGWINSEGSLVLKLKVTLKNLPDVTYYSKQEEIRLACKNELSEHLASLVDDKSSSDVTIITKEGTKLFAHKAILQARCLVFVSMLGSELGNEESYSVKLDNISTKTMKILLNFWYTGEISPSWKDDDVIIEFTYAVGKYKITSLLKMIDDLLGQDLKVSHVDVDLLKMVQKLSLKNAEARFLEKIVYKISHDTSCVEILALFALETEKIEQETFVISDVLRAFDDVLSENNEKVACFLDVKLMALACKYGMKNVENKFLQRIICTLKKVTNAYDLFALFDEQTE